MKPVHLSPYCPQWPQEFERVRLELLAAFAPQAVTVEHIGSTAVPGLCAKPVIDVLLGAGSLEVIEAAAPAMLAAGYRFERRYETLLPQRRYFVRPEGTGPRVHVHGVCSGSPLARRHLAFRDALRADAALRQRYAALKTALALEHAHDKAAYTDAKAPFILAVLADAEAAAPGA